MVLKGQLDPERTWSRIFSFVLQHGARNENDINAERGRWEMMEKALREYFI